MDSHVFQSHCLHAAQAQYDDADARIAEELSKLAQSEEVALSTDDALGQAAQTVIARSGIRDVEAALLASLLPVGVAAGSSRLIDFGGRRLNASLNTIFVADGLFAGMHVDVPFSGLRRMQEANVALGADEDFARRYAKDSVVRLQKSAAQEKRVLEALECHLDFQSDKERQEYVARAVQIREKVGDIGDPGHRTAVEVDLAGKASVEAKRRCGDALRLLKPISFVESLAPEAALSADRFSVNGACACIDPHGLELSQLVVSSYKTRSKVASRALASFEGNVAIIDGRPTVCPWFSLICRGRTDAVKKYCRDSVLMDGGMVHRTIWVDLGGREIKPMRLGWELENLKDFEGIVGNLYRSQAQGDVRCYRLSEDGIKAYENFCAEIQQIVLRVRKLGDWLEVWPRLILKAALLFHIGSSTEPAAIVPGIRIEVAARLLKRVGASGLLWILNNGLLKSSAEIRADGELQRLVAKVRFHQPLTRRQLCRSYCGKRLADLEPVLEVAMRKGLVVEKHGLLSAVRS